MTTDEPVGENARTAATIAALCADRDAARAALVTLHRERADLVARVDSLQKALGKTLAEALQARNALRAILHAVEQGEAVLTAFEG